MDSQQMEVILARSNKGGEKVFIGEFGYHFRSRNAKDEYRWVCTHRKSMCCRSSVLTRMFGDKHKISRAPTEHNHPATGHDKSVCKISNHTKAKAKEQLSIKPLQSTKLDVDPLAKEVLSSERTQAQKVQLLRAKKRERSVESDAHSCSSPQANGQMLKEECCWDSIDIVEDVQNRESNQNTMNTCDEGIKSNGHRDDDSFHVNEMKIFPTRKPFVCSEQEADGTVNIRIFLEESLLSSFVINAQHTSNVNIRISKDDLQRNS